MKEYVLFSQVSFIHITVSNSPKCENKFFATVNKDCNDIKLIFQFCDYLFVQGKTTWGKCVDDSILKSVAPDIVI